MAVICTNCGSAETQSLADRYCCVACGRTFVPGEAADPAPELFLGAGGAMTTTGSLGTAGGGTPPRATPPDIDWNSLTKAVLIEVAVAAGHEPASSATKADLVSLLKGG